MFVHGNRDVPGAGQPSRELHQITGLNLHELVALPFREDLHLAFQQIASLLRRVRPWKFAGRTAPPSQIAQREAYM
ncbi:hypothetical protein ZIOFF_020607 [Zingiber officinale]|uniref:Uncharacterized protein n=1 Tax=Zingiber officinale TaxID=94328 RepID=A0A8J5HA96_ZINOF|nr:hypothetical protein ZIOFF_020607 [Zingiber officinale]